MPFELTYDASDNAVGAVLAQWKENKPYAIYSVRRTLDDAQMNYATTEKVFLAVVFTLEKFRSHFINSKVIIFTDYVALKHLLKKFDSRAPSHSLGASSLRI